MQNPYSVYQNNSVSTASKEELTLMLYEGAIKFLNQCIIAINNEDFVKANTLNKRVQDIIRELQVTLNFDFPISKDFYNLYDYMFRTLVLGNVKKDIKQLEDVLMLLREFKEMWKEAMRLAKK